MRPIYVIFGANILGHESDTRLIIYSPASHWKAHCEKVSDQVGSTEKHITAIMSIYGEIAVDHQQIKDAEKRHIVFIENYLRRLKEKDWEVKGVELDESLCEVVGGDLKKLLKCPVYKSFWKESARTNVWMFVGLVVY